MSRVTPPAWARAKIGDVVGCGGLFIDGDWVETKDQDPEGDVRLVQLADVGDGCYRNKSSRYLTSSKAKELGCTFLQRGDVLIARMPDPLGRACVFPGYSKSAVTVVDVCIVRTGSLGADQRWLMYQVNTPQFRADVSKLQSGSTRKRISRGNLATIEFPLPPLPEQKRIVAKIEELFSDLDAGVEALKKAKAEIKRYRQAILNCVFLGKLTEGWRKANKDKTEPVEKLIERIRESLRRTTKGRYSESEPETLSELPELPERWAYGVLGDFIYIAGRIGWRGLKAEEYTEDGPLFLSVYNLNKGKIVDFEGAYHISEERYDESPEIQLRNDDILLTKDGAGIGKIGIVKGLKTEATVNSSLLVIRAGEAFVPEFLLYFLMGPRMQGIVRERITGSATPHLFQRDIKKFVLLLPPRPEQEVIVQEVERRFSVADEAEKVVDRSLKQAETLRQSILKRAFQGRLVPQDPKDEPASKLLERIREERARLGGPSSKVKAQRSKQ
jgi:type I restriction enzyme S subunit